MTPESERVKLWREANKERYNQRMKEYMKARRAKKAQEKKDAKFIVTTIPYKPDA